MERRLQLQPRLQLLADMTPAGCRLADIGTDHGYRRCGCCKESVSKALLPRTSAQSLWRTRGGLRRNMAWRVSASACVTGWQYLSGGNGYSDHRRAWGGETIIAILESATWTKDGAHTLLLQPMTKASELRRWLSVNGYTFTDERLVWDKNYLYPVLRVNGGICPALTELQTLTGVLLDGDPLYADYLTQHAEKLLHIAEGLRRSGREDALHRAEAAEALAQQIEEKRKTL